MGSSLVNGKRIAGAPVIFGHAGLSGARVVASKDRLLNECHSCGHTWYSRKSRIIPRCPSCGSGAVGLANEELGNQTHGESQKAALQALTRHVVSRLGEGASVDAVTDELVKELAIARDAAGQFVGTVHARLVDEVRRSPEGRKALRDRHARHMLYGILWLAGGGLLTLLAYKLAKGGGVYFIFWGAMLWGAIEFIRGLIGWGQNLD